MLSGLEALTCDQAALCWAPLHLPPSPQPQMGVDLQGLTSRTFGLPASVPIGEMLPLLPHTPARRVLALTMPAGNKDLTQLAKYAQEKVAHSTHQVSHRPHNLLTIEQRMPASLQTIACQQA